jgi:hypothetical protein
MLLKKWNNKLYKNFHFKFLIRSFVLRNYIINYSVKEKKFYPKNLFNEKFHHGDLYVDKSLFIKEFLEEKEKNISISLPDNFGKFLSLNLLKEFLENKFNNEENKNKNIGLSLNLSSSEEFLYKEEENINQKEKEIFNKKYLNSNYSINKDNNYNISNEMKLSLKINEHKYIIESYYGKFPVILLDLKIKNNYDNNKKNNNIFDYQNFFNFIKFSFSNIFQEKEYLKNNELFSEKEKDFFNKMQFCYSLENKNLELEVFEDSLIFLLELLHKQHGQKCFIFIYGLDSILFNTYVSHDLVFEEKEKIFSFLKNLLKKIYKNNNLYEKSLLMNNLPISKEKFLREILEKEDNNKIYNATKLNSNEIIEIKFYENYPNKYYKHFGFCENEIKDLFFRVKFPRNLFEDFKIYFGGYSFDLNLSIPGNIIKALIYYKDNKDISELFDIKKEIFREKKTENLKNLQKFLAFKFKNLNINMNSDNCFFLKEIFIKNSNENIFKKFLLLFKNQSISFPLISFMDKEIKYFYSKEDFNLLKKEKEIEMEKKSKNFFRGFINKRKNININCNFFEDNEAEIFSVMFFFGELNIVEKNKYRFTNLGNLRSFYFLFFENLLEIKRYQCPIGDLNLFVEKIFTLLNEKDKKNLKTTSIEIRKLMKAYYFLVKSLHNFNIPFFEKFMKFLEEKNEESLFILKGIIEFWIYKEIKNEEILLIFDRNLIIVKNFEKKNMLYFNVLYESNCQVAYREAILDIEINKYNYDFDIFVVGVNVSRKKKITFKSEIISKNSKFDQETKLYKNSCFIYHKTTFNRRLRIIYDNIIHDKVT